MKSLKLVFLTIVFQCCNYSGHVSYINSDLSKNIEKRKVFFIDLEFEAKIISKYVHEKSSISPFRLDLEIIKIYEEVDLSNVQFSPYYAFTSLNLDTLNLSVTKEIYEEASQGYDLQKEKGSNGVFIQGIMYELLNSKKNVWFVSDAF